LRGQIAGPPAGRKRVYSFVALLFPVKEKQKERGVPSPKKKEEEQNRKGKKKKAKVREGRDLRVNPRGKY